MQIKQFCKANFSVYTFWMHIQRVNPIVSVFSVENSVESVDKWLVFTLFWVLKAVKRHSYQQFLKGFPQNRVLNFVRKNDTLAENHLKKFLFCAIFEPSGGKLFPGENGVLYIPIFPSVARVFTPCYTL